MDLCKEFFINFQSVENESRSTSIAGGIPIDFSVESIRTFLNLLPSENPFVCTSEVAGRISGSFAHITLNQIHQHYFGRARPPLANIFESRGMSAENYVWYKIIVECILPIVTRGRSKIRSPHLIMMYALEHHLDIDVARHIYETILFHSSIVNQKIYMPYCHIITAYLAYRGVDTSVGDIHPLSKSYDLIGQRHLRLAKIEYLHGALIWGRHAAQGDPEAEAEEGDGDADAPHAEEIPPPHGLDERISHLEGVVDQHYQALQDYHQDLWTYHEEIQEYHEGLQTYHQEVHELRQEWSVAAQQQQAMYQQQQEMYDMMRQMHLYYQPPPPPPPADDGAE